MEMTRTVDSAVGDALFALIADVASLSGGVLPAPLFDPGLARVSAGVLGDGATRTEAWLSVVPVAPVVLRVELGGPEREARLLEHRLDIDWIVQGTAPAPGQSAGPGRDRFESGKALIAQGLALPRAIQPGHAGLIATDVWVEWDETTIAADLPARSILSAVPDLMAATLRIRALYTATSPLAT
jgi:hypothetical protein